MSILLLKNNEYHKKKQKRERNKKTNKDKKVIRYKAEWSVVGWHILQERKIIDGPKE